MCFFFKYSIPAKFEATPIPFNFFFSKIHRKYNIRYIKSQIENFASEVDTEQGCAYCPPLANAETTPLFAWYVYLRNTLTQTLLSFFNVSI